MDKVTVEYREHTIDCYGTWEYDSNCLIIGTWPDGTELEEFFADGAVDWMDAVHRICDSFDMQGCHIIELQAC